jgi:hypothetical protein
VAYWTDAGLEKEEILHRLRDLLVTRRHVVAVDRGWSFWDLDVRGGIWSRALVTVCAENHGGTRRVLRVRGALRTGALTRLVLGAALVTEAAGIVLAVKPLTIAGAVAGVLAIAAFAREAGRLGRALHQALETVARRLRLRPLHGAPPRPVEHVDAPAA